MIDWNLTPDEIEARSFQIIDRETPAHDWDQDSWTIIRRLIHTSADFEYVSSVRVHPHAVAAGVAAITQGRSIVTDTRMAFSGISKRRLTPFGVTVTCLMDRPDVAELARIQGTTRAVAAVDLALEAVRAGSLDIGIWVIGNAPTALFNLLTHLAAGDPPPALIVGLPVGFVNAAEAKEALTAGPVPFITALGRKGGSNVAAATINALADLAAAGRESSASSDS